MSPGTPPRSTRRSLGLAAGGLAAAAGLLFPALARAGAPVRVASKPDTEGTLLGSIMIRMLNANAIATENRIGLGPTRIIRAAILSGAIDLYPEYTGNGAFFFHMESNPAWRNAAAGYALAKRLGRERDGLVWLAPAPADNAWSIVLRADVAAANGLRTMEDFARWVNSGGKVKLAASAEFVESPAALPAFETTYGFNLKADQILMLVGGNTAATIRAAAEDISGVNAAMAYRTDGALAVLRLVLMRDIRNAQIIFEPAPVIREPVLRAYPAIASILAPVFATLDTPTLRRLNARVTVDGEDAAQVAADYLRRTGLLG